jgi:hypothetical protein
LEINLPKVNSKTSDNENLSFYLKNVDKLMATTPKTRPSNVLMPFGFAQSLKRRKTVTSNDSGLRFSEAIADEKSKGGTFKGSMQRKLSLQPGTPNAYKNHRQDSLNLSRGKNQIKQLFENAADSHNSFSKFAGVRGSFDRSPYTNL